MSGEQEWKRLKLYEKEENGYRNTKEEKETGTCEVNCTAEKKDSDRQLSKREEQREHSSKYLIARDEQQEERRKDLLYRILGPVFFGKKEADSWQELVELFRCRYGIDVEHDFFEGDEHYEEYLEARQAIAEGMSIYSGSIAFDDSIMAEYAERLWEDMEQMEQGRFRRINTMLEE